jgi:simple sugar transport system permease protein
MGGLVVALTGKNPIKVYHAVWNGTGINWFFHVGNHSARVPFSTHQMWFPWDTASIAAGNLQQTLLLTTPIILTALALAFAFRCGLFNIGGQGQYLVGSIFALWVGSSFLGMNGPLHIVLAIVAATLAGAAYAGIAGLLKALTGAHEVISTIMLNWIAVWVGSWLVGQGGALQSQANGGTTPISSAVAQSTHLHVFWGSPVLQGLDVGVFFALAALLVYSVLLNRTTLGFELRTVGFNPEAARYAGMSVARTYVTTMTIAGAFAGLAGAIDVLGWEFQLGVTDIQTSEIGFIAIAVAVLGRNRAVGVLFAALLFGALLTGTSTRNLDATVFRPDLASNLTLIIQGLVVLFVGADVLVLWLWNRRRRLRVAT